jgi:hypothetical protein
MKKHREITLEQARRIGDSLYLDWEQVDLEQFRQGLMGFRREGSEYHGVLMAGRTVMQHMEQFPDYFVRLARLRAEARMYPARVRSAAGLQRTGGASPSTS